MFCEMAWLYAARSSSNRTRCRSVYDDNGESILIMDEVGKTERAISFLTYSAPLAKQKHNLKSQDQALSLSKIFNDKP